LLAWRILIEIIKVSPILGLGPANYYFYTPLFPILGYAVRFNSHNNYVDIIAQIGLLGLAAYLWFLWETGRLGLRLRSIALDGFERAYVYGAIGGLAGMLVAGMLGDWVIPFVYNVGFDGFRASVLGWLFLGGLVILERSYKKNTTPTSIVNLK
jgi:O-Antigen ligase